ncbi:LysR family transcriptional regulator [Celeribacter sp.]|uniref:LysR family transcriptional regulator n=1 Tax=Celeribacter sp. TaxID=1890673 RepID=UPI003A9233E4
MSDTVNRLTLWAVDVFLTTAEEGSITAAARRLGASPSAISQQLTNLEALFGAELLNRRERPVTLTPAGRIFRPRAQRIRDEANSARSDMARLDLSQLGNLRLGMVEDFEATVTPQLITGMAEHLKNTRFELETGPSHRLLDALEHRACDVAVAADMGTHAPWMEVRPLLRDPFVAMVPKGMRADQALAEGLPLINYTRRHAMGRELASHLLDAGLAPAQRFELDSYRAMIAMVAAGNGWTILTALGALHAGRFADQIEVEEMPVAPLERRLSLFARRDEMGEIADDIAARLRRLIGDNIVTPARADWPWLGDRLSVLGG